jgi:hypothetical protein
MQASNSYREQLTLHQSKILASLPTDDSLMQLQQKVAPLRKIVTFLLRSTRTARPKTSSSRLDSTSTRSKKPRRACRQIKRRLSRTSPFLSSSARSNFFNQDSCRSSRTARSRKTLFSAISSASCTPTSSRSPNTGSPNTKYLRPTKTTISCNSCCSAGFRKTSSRNRTISSKTISPPKTVFSP